MTLAIGVDVGGTKAAAGVVDEDGRIIAKLKRSTPAASPARTEQAIADAVTELLGHHQVTAIGLGAAGALSANPATAPGPRCCSPRTSPGATSRSEGVSEAGDLLLDPARAAFERALTGRGYRPLAEIKVAQLGEDAGIVGAADLARQVAALQAQAPPSTAGQSTAAPSIAGQAMASPSTAPQAVIP